MKTKTVVEVVLKNGRKYRCSFEGDWSLDEYITNNSIFVGDEKFLKVRCYENDDSYANQTIINIGQVGVIRIDHEFSTSN